MMVVAASVFSLLQAVALLHLAWAIGLSWPARSREKLSATVIGLPEGSPMPPAWLTILVALGISLAGWLALWGGGWFSLGEFEPLRKWGVGAGAVVFALRGGMTYMPFGPLQASAEPFRTLDSRFFAPLCLILAIGYLLLWLGR